MNLLWSCRISGIFPFDKCVLSTSLIGGTFSTIRGSTLFDQET